MGPIRALEGCRDWMFRRDIMQYWLIFWGQTLGEALFSFVNINLVNQIKLRQTSAALKVVYTSAFFAMSLFINISFGRQFSGGVFNPAVAFFRLFRRTDRYKISVGLLYMGSQFLGATIGMITAFYLCDLQQAPVTEILPVGQQFYRCFFECMGAFILTFMAQYAIEKKMTFCGHNKELYIWLPLLYLTARGLSAKSNGINPALGWGFQFGWCLKRNRWDVMSMVYIRVIPPFIGAFLSAMAFEYVLRPLFPIKQEELKQIIRQIEQHHTEIGKARAKKKKNHRITIGQAVDMTRDEEIPINIRLQDIYDFGMIEDLQEQEQIISIPSDEQEVEQQNFAFQAQNLDELLQSRGAQLSDRPQFLVPRPLPF